IGGARRRAAPPGARPSALVTDQGCAPGGAPRPAPPASVRTTIAQQHDFQSENRLTNDGVAIMTTISRRVAKPLSSTSIYKPSSQDEPTLESTSGSIPTI